MVYKQKQKQRTATETPYRYWNINDTSCQQGAIAIKQ